MRAALGAIARRRHPPHVAPMQRATLRPPGFAKPAHWSDAPPPQPAAPEPGEPHGPTRYGDWVKDGIAVDF